MSTRALFFVILAVKWLVCIQATEIQWKQSISFNYMDGDPLNIKIELKNVSSEASWYSLYYKTREKKTQTRYGNIPSDGILEFKVKLQDKARLIVYVELNNSIGICSEKMIMSGTMDNTLNRTDSKDSFRKKCMRKYNDDICKIIVDYENKCDAPPTTTQIPTTSTKSTHFTTTSTASTHFTTTPTTSTHFTTTPTTSTTTQTATNNTTAYIAIASVVGTIILVSVIYVMIKKVCRKSSESKPTLELDTYATVGQPLYAELEIRSGNRQPPPKTEDSPYAEIIGVLKPHNQYVVK